LSYRPHMPSTKVNCAACHFPSAALAALL